MIKESTVKAEKNWTFFLGTYITYLGILNSFNQILFEEKKSLIPLTLLVQTLHYYQS